MPRLALGLLAVMCALLATALIGAGTAHADGPHVDVVNFNRDVDAPSTSFLTNAIDTAQSDGATALVILIDTPGGDLNSTWTIQEKELGATIPLVTYVSPQGAHAASAGAILALAAPIAAMAPNTEIGATAPVDASGNDLPPTLATKVKNDTIARLTAEQKTFNRNTETVTQMVQNAMSYNQDDALSTKTINYVEPSLDALLAQIDGQSVTLANGTNTTLHTQDLPRQELQPSLANEAETLLFDPNVLFLLFIVAAVCIYLELSHPGAIVPGTIGAIALLLFLFAAGSIQPNWAGLALMLLAIVLLAVDVRAPTHGVLTAAAIISLVLGALIFFDTGTSRATPPLNPAVLLGVVGAVALFAVAVLRAAIRAQRFPVKTGREGLVGERATVIDALSPDGRVRILGENWAARLATPFNEAGREVEAGSEVRVVRVDGLTLVVEPIFKLGDVMEGAMQ
jgi:membrane-bound serine protease (ClpP class)